MQGGDGGKDSRRASGFPTSTSLWTVVPRVREQRLVLALTFGWRSGPGAEGWRGGCWGRACRTLIVQRQSSLEWIKRAGGPVGGETVHP